jgi:hypothetical protein
VQGVQASFFRVNVLNQVKGLRKTRLRGHTIVYRPLIDEQFTTGSYELDARAKIYNSQVSRTRALP